MSSKLDSCDIIPIKSSNYQEVTPQRTRRKISRRDQSAPTITSSTPKAQQSSELIDITLNSPSSSFPSSQDVIWDYTSPKLPRGTRAKEWKLSATELLERLNQAKASGNNEHIQHRKLLEGFISKLNDNPTYKTENGRKRGNRKRPRNVLEYLNKQMESIPGLSKDCETVSKTRQGTSYKVEAPFDENLTSPKFNRSSKSFVEGESSECDSTEELWGEADNSFFVKATQELESVLPQKNLASQEDMSTIPETAYSPKTSNKPLNTDIEKLNDFLHQLTNMDWEELDDSDDWDNGFIEDEDNALSMIPEEALSGNVVVVSEPVVEVSRTIAAQSANTVIQNLKDSCNDGVAKKTETELYNSFEDDSFEDEVLLCQPEVLSKIDEVESLLSQQPRCTPEEIRKKKDEAMKRRQKKSLGKR